MQETLQYLAHLPFLTEFLLIFSLVLMGMDIRKLYRYATMDEKPKDFRFRYILPGITLFTLGFMLLRESVN